MTTTPDHAPGQTRVDANVGGEFINDELVGALRAVPLLAPAAADAVAHYAGHGDELRIEPGGHLADEGDEQAAFQILLAGRVEWTRKLAGSDVHVLTHTAGEYFGHEPILLDIPVPVTGTALETCRVFRFDTDAFWELLFSSPEIRRELLSAVSQRVQTLEGVSAQQARLAALGTLSAGARARVEQPCRRGPLRGRATRRRDRRGLGHGAPTGPSPA